MSTALTRAGFRDAIRRDLQKVVPFDEGTGAVGDQPVQTPNPNNATINQKLNEAIDYLNTEARFHANTDVELPIVGQSANGPFPVDLSTVITNEASGSVLDIRRAYWDITANPPGASGISVTGPSTFRLDPTTYDALDRDRVPWQQVPPSMPRWFWIEAYTLFVYPAPASAGTLKMICGTSLLHFETDADVLDQLPVSYHRAVQYTADWLLAIGSPTDAEMQAAAVRFQPLALEWVKKVEKWYATMNRQRQESLPLASYRMRSGTRRGRY